MASSTELEVNDYRALSAFRYCIRKFLRFSEEAARKAGIEPQHHQLMLAVKGLPEGTLATVGEIAERLQIQHHSSVELINRLAEQGLVQRKRAGGDRRQVLIFLTVRGERILRALSIHHREELQASAPELIAALRSILGGKRRAQARASASRARTPARRAAPAARYGRRAAR
ncbi:MAG: helix-turn-helix domain-containing protein [Candidatus Korobacteraceae bacterium]|jgi:DNA-binding MarR family transcriptional regulator